MFHLPSLRVVYLVVKLLPWQCLMMLVVASKAKTPPCRSAEEGMPFVLTCGGIGDSDQVEWDVVFNSPDQQKTTCTYYSDNNSPPCGADNGRNITVTSTKSETIVVGDPEKTISKFVSHLNLTVVTPGDRHGIVSCILRNNILKSTIQICTMDVYHKPETPQCTAVKSPLNSIKFECRTSKMYPHLKCEVVQLETQSKKRTEFKEGFTYSQMAHYENGIEYFQSSCCIEINHLQPGQYRYFGLLTPSVQYDKYVRNMSVPVMPTPPVTISEPKVTIHLPNNWRTFACPDSPETFHITCRASNFDKHPYFEWFIGSELRHSDFKADRIKDSDFTSTFKFNALVEHHGKSIECRVNTSTGLIINDYVRFGDQSPPSSSPKFDSNSGWFKNDRLVIAEGAKPVITCLVAGRNALTISSLLVVCRNDGDEFVNVQSSSTEAAFTVNATLALRTADCTCSARHNSRCYMWTTILYFTVIPKRNLPNISKFRVAPNVYIFAGIFGYILCSLVLALIFFFLCKRQKRGGCCCSEKPPIYSNSRPSRARSDSSVHEYEIVR